MQDMAKLCKENKGLVYHIAKRYADAARKSATADLDDLAQAGYIGLIRAAQTYQPDKGKTWASWACWYIQGEMAAALGRNRIDAVTLSLDKPLAEDGEDTLLDTLPGDADTSADADHAEMRQAVRDSVSGLANPQHREAIERVYWQGQTLKGAAVAMHRAAPTVAAFLRAGMRQMARSHELQAVAEAWLDRQTDWHRHVTLGAYRRTWTSSTEEIAFWREQQRKQVSASERKALKIASGSQNVTREEKTVF